MNDRYARQTALRQIGAAGQEKLGKANVVIVGAGALGCMQAQLLCRAGIGHLRLIDRDSVEMNNLQRQLLYTEEDAADHMPKAEAARRRLEEINSSVTLEAVIADLNSSNAEALLKDADLVMDAADNMPTRCLINEVCVKYRIPWIYGGAVGTEGMTMNILPEGPCLCCMTGKSHYEGDGRTRTCSTVGVLNSLTSIIASVQCTEAFKILTGSGHIRKGLLFVELWDNETQQIAVEKDPDCPVCGRGEYWYLSHGSGTKVTALCGKDSVQIVPGKPQPADLEALEKKLASLGTVKRTRFCLDFESREASFVLFPDGRAVIRHTDSEGRAKSVYSEYIGFL